MQSHFFSGNEGYWSHPNKLSVRLVALIFPGAFFIGSSRKNSRRRPLTPPPPPPARQGSCINNNNRVRLTWLIQIRYLQLRVHRGGNPQHEHRGRSRDTPPAPPPHFVSLSRTAHTLDPANPPPTPARPPPPGDLNPTRASLALFSGYLASRPFWTSTNCSRCCCCLCTRCCRRRRCCFWYCIAPPSSTSFVPSTTLPPFFFQSRPLATRSLRLLPVHSMTIVFRAARLLLSTATSVPASVAGCLYRLFLIATPAERTPGQCLN